MVDGTLWWTGDSSHCGSYRGMVVVVVVVVVHCCRINKTWHTQHPGDSSGLNELQSLAAARREPAMISFLHGNRNKIRARSLVGSLFTIVYTAQRKCKNSSQHRLCWHFLLWRGGRCFYQPVRPSNILGIILTRTDDKITH